jgi:hypothetical protein
MNLLGPELVRDLVALIQQAEADDSLRVLVFKSADPEYFISHVDVTRITEYRQEAARLTGAPSIALLFRHLSASRLITIAQIEGRVRAAGRGLPPRFRSLRRGRACPRGSKPDPGRDESWLPDLRRRNGFGANAGRIGRARNQMLTGLRIAFPIV